MELTDIKKDVNVMRAMKLTIQDYMYDYTSYLELQNQLKEIFYNGYEYNEVRNCPIEYRTTSDSNWNTMLAKHMYTNLIVWKLVVEFDIIDKFNNSFVFNCDNISRSYVDMYINKMLSLRNPNIPIPKVNNILSECIYELGMVAADFSDIIGIGINVETFIDLAERNPEYDEIIHTHIDENLQPIEAEAELNDIKNRMINIILDDPGDNLLKPLIASGGGIKVDQLVEFSVSGGFKPDLYGNTIPYIINSNILMGMTDLVQYYIDSMAGRKSAILNKMVMGKSGHLSRMIITVASRINLSKSELEQCDTVHPIPIVIKNRKMLNRLIGRYYVTKSNQEHYNIICEGDTHLVNKKIYLYSPVTCNSKDGICKVCYGKMFDLNKGINVGAYASTKMTQHTGQDILSVKHHVKTDSTLIQFSDPLFDKIFVIRGNTICLEVSPDIDNITDLAIVFPSTTMTPVEDYEGDGSLYVAPYISILNMKNGELTQIHETGGQTLIISEDMIKILKSKCKTIDGNIICPLSIIDDDQHVASISITNNEMTKPLYDMMDLLNRNSHNNCNTITEIVINMMELILSAGIKLDFVHGEVILRSLIFSKNSTLKYPDFSTFGPESDYQILRVFGAASNGPSATIGLGTQFLSRQIKTDIYDKTEPSYMDPFFKLTLD